MRINEMQSLFRYTLAIVLMLGLAMGGQAQVNRWKVKKKETIYGIATSHGLTVDELVKANPHLGDKDYKLKKGEELVIPTKVEQKAVAQPAPKAKEKKADDVTKRAIRLGVMLPLHNDNGDGRRMVEYYRGMLMAIDSLRTQGLSVEVFAWNLAEQTSVETILADPNAARCDLIVGPLYSTQVPALSAFVEKHKQLLLIPFSIRCPELLTNSRIFQVYQSQNEQKELTVRRYATWFADAHTVIVDCDDANSDKWLFTKALRQQLESDGHTYNLTSLSTADDKFVKAFVKGKRNVVVPNTASPTAMNALFGKLSMVCAQHPDMQVTTFGYTEWLTQASRQLDNFYRFDVYVPSTFYTNVLSPVTERLTKLYRRHFRQDMQQLFPRFALTGFDHAFFFLKGLHKYGMTFDGAAGRFGYPPVQTPLKFERAGDRGGRQNHGYMFVHYKNDHHIETINY